MLQIINRNVMRQSLDEGIAKQKVHVVSITENATEKSKSIVGTFLRRIFLPDKDEEK